MQSPTSLKQKYFYITRSRTLLPSLVDIDKMTGIIPITEVLTNGIHKSSWQMASSSPWISCHTTIFPVCISQVWPQNITLISDTSIWNNLFWLHFYSLLSPILFHNFTTESAKHVHEHNRHESEYKEHKHCDLRPRKKNFMKNHKIPVSPCIRVYHLKVVRLQKWPSQSFSVLTFVILPEKIRRIWTCFCLSS